MYCFFVLSALSWNKLAIKLAIISYYIQLPQSLNAQSVLVLLINITTIVLLVLNGSSWLVERELYVLYDRRYFWAFHPGTQKDFGKC